MNIDTPVGRSLLSRVVGDEARYAAECQFHLTRCEKRAAWVISQDPNAVNPTQVNGNVVPLGGVPLSTGDRITIAADKAPIKVKIDF